MGTTRCMMCGKENPDELEVCRFCQARLKPLALSSAGPPDSEGENESTSPAGDENLHAAELPHWLHDLRSLEDSQQPEFDASPEKETPAELPFEAAAIESEPIWSEWNSESGAELAPERQQEPPLAAVENQPQSSPDESLAAHGADLGTGRVQEPSPESEGEPPPSAGSDSLGAQFSGSGLETGGPGHPAHPAAAPYPTPGGPPAAGPAEVPAVPSSQSTQPVETAGPLAGLRGLLAADASVSRSHPQSTQPAKLRISANQLVHVDLLRKLLEEEGKAQPIPSRRPISSEHLIRWGIAFALLMAVLWSVLSPGQPAPLPLYQEEAAELNRLIEQLPEGAPVLVAFDYEPALSAEMDTAAYPVLDHLMLKGAALTLVSSSASGPILAERFMQRLWPVHHYSADQQYTNLGYVPGGPAGLASLARNLTGTLPYTIDSLYAWNSSEGPARPPLAGIQDLTDYPLILVLVDDADTARAWVEQLQPYLSEPAAQSSLAMVTSAQVEPIVWPYFDSNPRQVHGFISGMRGGASYARLSGREDMPRHYWNSFGMGLFIAVLLILVGGLFYVTYPMLARPAKADSEAAR